MEVRAAVAVQAGKPLEVTTMKLDGRKSATLVYWARRLHQVRSRSALGMGGR
jgi:hypothetical protein